MASTPSSLARASYEGWRRGTSNSSPKASAHYERALAQQDRARRLENRADQLQEAGRKAELHRKARYAYENAIEELRRAVRPVPLTITVLPAWFALRLEMHRRSGLAD